MCTSKSKVHAESVYRLFLKQDINQQEAFFASFGAQQIRTSAPSTSTHADKKSHMEAIWRIISSSPFRQRIHFSARQAKNCLAHTHTYTPSKQREINSQSATAAADKMRRPSPDQTASAFSAFSGPLPPIAGDLFAHCFDSNEVK
jgi:hypothetical protein